MAKNNKFINQAKSIARYYKNDQNIVDMMSGFIVVLYKNIEGITDEQIEYLIGQVQAEWDKAAAEGYSMADYCEELTGFDVRRRQD